MPCRTDKTAPYLTEPASAMIQTFFIHPVPNPKLHVVTRNQQFFGLYWKKTSFSNLLLTCENFNEKSYKKRGQNQHLIMYITYNFIK